MEPPDSINAHALYNVLLSGKAVQLAPHIRDNDFIHHMPETNAARILELLPTNYALLEYRWFDGRYYAFLLCNCEITLHYIKYDAAVVNATLLALLEQIAYKDKTDKIIDELYEMLFAPIDEQLDKLQHLYVVPAGLLIKMPFELLCDKFTVSYLSTGGDLVRHVKLPQTKSSHAKLPQTKSSHAKLPQTKSSHAKLPQTKSSHAKLPQTKLPQAKSSRAKLPRAKQKYKSALIIADPLYDLPKDKYTREPYGDILPGHSGDIETSNIFTQCPGGNETSNIFTQCPGGNETSNISTQCPGSNEKSKVFTRLPYGRMEADTLDRIFRGTVIKKYGPDAKKSVLGEINTADIIHIVTHGFFVDKKSTGMDVLPHAMADDPLLRCGLAFSGANTWLRSREKGLITGYGDGILTAKDVLALGFLKTDLLVLSACETGLGNTGTGEGIHGLRHAFELAGARTVICTLWNIDDESGAILMEAFYTNLLINGMDKNQALQCAKNHVRQMTNRQLLDYYKKHDLKRQAVILEKQCKSNKTRDVFNDLPFSHPYYWAGYILHGACE